MLNTKHTSQDQLKNACADVKDPYYLSDIRNIEMAWFVTNCTTPQVLVICYWTYIEKGPIENHYRNTDMRSG